MKNPVTYLIAAIIVTLYFKFYVLCTALSLLLGVSIIFGIKRTVAIFELYTNMPTVWQNISETIVLGEKYWFEKNEDRSFGTIAMFYRAMEMFEIYFEFKIDEVILATFESKYLHNGYYPNIPSRTKILYYFINARDHNPERLPDIEKAVLVKKRVGGQRKPKEDRIEKTEFKPALV